MVHIHPSSPDDLPYSFSRLDDLMDGAGIDVLLVTSKHNVRYLLGGYRFIFFAAMDAIGHSRYLPVLVYVRGSPDRSAYVANTMESDENENHPFWVPHFFPTAWNTTDAMQTAVDHLANMGFKDGRIGVEPSFFPIDAQRFLSERLPDSRVADATHVLERVRSIKSESELGLLRKATELISDSMIATIAGSHPGDSKHQIIQRLRREEIARELDFEYCLLTLGSSHNRAASGQAWKPGEVLSIDSGGTFHGYIGDICRMGILGEPDTELDDLLGQVEAVQQAAFAEVKDGVLGREVIDQAIQVRSRLEHADCTDFFAHGMGIIAHEVPFLVTNHPVTYYGTDADQPLEAGMVLSIETTMKHPDRGFIKLEDTICVSESGFELFGGDNRGWNSGGLHRQ